MAGAVVSAIALTLLLPDDVRLGPSWCLPALEAVLLIAVVVVDPGRIDRRTREIRMLSIGLIGVLACGSFVSAALLVRTLIEGSAITNEATPLLEAGGQVLGMTWLTFALLYWELDCGGAASRAHEMPRTPDFAFPQQLNPEIAPPVWRPRFADYLYLSMTNSIAFSPTDTMPLSAWAKLLMASQALLSFVVIGLVVARAVNVFS
jgi:uncharacterized membrane protein